MNGIFRKITPPAPSRLPTRAKNLKASHTKRGLDFDAHFSTSGKHRLTEYSLLNHNKIETLAGRVYEFSVFILKTLATPTISTPLMTLVIVLTPPDRYQSAYWLSISFHSGPILSRHIFWRICHIWWFAIYGPSISMKSTYFVNVFVIYFLFWGPILSRHIFWPICHIWWFAIYGPSVTMTSTYFVNVFVIYDNCPYIDPP
jgi:hypothetical protein